MDSQTSGTAPCPTCGEQWTTGHTCTSTDPSDATPAEAGDTGLTDTGRIQIPEALLNTGLFRAAWKPSSTQASEPVDSIFERVETPAPAEEAPVNTPDTPGIDETPAVTDPFLAPQPDAVEPTVVVAPAAVIDPWAGLDVKLTDDVKADEAPRDPWADLEPAGGFDAAPEELTEPEADDVEPEITEAAVEVEPEPEAEPQPEVAEPEVAEFETSDEPASFVATNFSEVSADDVVVHAAPEEPVVEEPVEDAPVAEVPAGEPDELSPIAAAEAAAVAALASENALVPPPLPAQPFLPLAEYADQLDADDVAEDVAGEPAIPVDSLEETAAIDMAAAMQTGPANLEPVPEPEVSAFDLYGDSLYAPATEAVDLTAASEPVLPDVALTAAGVTSASLPESVPFAPGIGIDGNPAVPDAATEPDKEPRRINKAIAAGVAGVVLVAAGGGWFWWNGQKDAPVKDAFSASHGGFTNASTQLRQATSISDIATAGESFESNLDLQRATDEKTRESNSDVSLAARRAAVAEAAVAAAAAPLKDLSASDLSSWADTQDVLRESLEGLEAVRSDIETAGGTTDLLPSVEVVDQIRETIAAEVVDGAADTVTTLSAKLESASLLADIRAVGASAGEYVTPLAEAAKGIEDPAQKDEMQAVVEFHEALSGFSKLRPATLDSWSDRLKDAEKAAENLSDETRPAAEAGLAAADATVKKSTTEFEKWETKNAEAKADKEADLADLATATTTVAGATTTLASLDSELDAILDDAGAAPAEDEPNTVATRLDAAATARESLLASLEALTVVPRAEAELKALVDIVSADATAVRAAAGAAAACTDECVAGTRPEVSALETRTTLTSWNAAVPFWDTQVEDATEAVKKRKLPARPKI